MSFAVALAVKRPFMFTPDIFKDHNIEDRNQPYGEHLANTPVWREVVGAKVVVNIQATEQHLFPRPGRVLHAAIEGNGKLSNYRQIEGSAGRLQSLVVALDLNTHVWRGAVGVRGKSRGLA